MPRPVWKGAITFGLVHIPIALYPATEDSGIDFDWLDKRSMDPVGYKRVNKRTGRDIAKENVVKGIKQEDGEYVVLSEDEIKAAFPKSTQTIEIECFVKASEIAFPLLEKPYILEPVGKSEKVYALLRESMLTADVIGIARIIMHTKEHLAALMPLGSALMLNTIRWESDIRSIEGLKLPAAGKAAASLKAGELKMGAQLIHDMTTTWQHKDYTDSFSTAINKLVSRKIKAGETEHVEPIEEAPAEARGSNIIDLTELLANSLAKRKQGAGQAQPAAAEKAASKPKRKRAG